jgi:hypothetical protein
MSGEPIQICNRFNEPLENTPDTALGPKLSQMAAVVSLNFHSECLKVVDTHRTRYIFESNSGGIVLPC